MVLPWLMAGLGAAGSFVSGMGARRSAKRQERLQAHNWNVAKDHNLKQSERMNKRDQQLGKWLNKQKEVTTETRSGSDTRSSVVSSSFDADAMMKAAEASGINPITFLRNGGMAAFIKTNTDETDTYGSSVTTTRTGHNAVAVADLKRYKPYYITEQGTTHVPSAGEAIGGAMTQFANAGGDIVARQGAQDFTAAQAEKHQAFQRELMMMSLAGTQKGGSVPGGRSFYTPGFSTAGSAVTRQTNGGLAPITQGDREFTNPFRNGSGITVDPNQPNAEQAESRYGDLMQELFGVWTLGTDVWHNVKRYLATSPTANTIGKWGKDLGLSVSYDPTPRPLTFRVKTPKSQPMNYNGR